MVDQVVHTETVIIAEFTRLIIASQIFNGIFDVNGSYNMS